MFGPMYRGDWSPLDEPEYKPPAEFDHNEWNLVATFPKDGGDGQAAEVYESRLPASFWMLKALGDTNSVGEPVPGFSLSTGSGDEMGHLAFAIARAAARGMIGVYEET